jgi:hypothetical protein
MDVEISGNVGFHGRSMPLRMKDCTAIENARIEALKQAGHTHGNPKAQVYESEDNLGMAHTHAYTVAAAGLIDQIDKALSGPTHAPVRIAVESAIAETCYLLGCRDTHPLEWNPTHIPHDIDTPLDEDDIIQAWILAKLRCDMTGHNTADTMQGPLKPSAWQQPSDYINQAQGPKLWENQHNTWGDTTRAMYIKRFAYLGITHWRDITHVDTGQWLTWPQLRKRHPQLKGKTDNQDYTLLIRTLDTANNENSIISWRQHLHELRDDDDIRGTDRWNPHTHDTPPDIGTPIASRRASPHLGNWEYACKTNDNHITWHTHTNTL